MAKFFVGQRVRIVRIERRENAHLVGMEGRISDTLEAFIPGCEGYGLDICPITVMHVDGIPRVSAFHSYQLAPIAPEGHAPAQFGFHELMDRLRSGVVA